MLKQRIITALVLIPVFVLSVLYLNTLLFMLLMACIISLAAWEWAGFSGNNSAIARAGYTIFILLILFTVYFFRSSLLSVGLITLALLWWLLALYFVTAYQRQTSPDSVIPFPTALIGVFVLVPAWLALLLLHAHEPDGILLVLLLFILIWSADIAAYFSGRRWGKKRLCSRVSPGKSWEGVYGALLSAAGIGLIYALFQQLQGVEILIFTCICIITVLSSILGDLLESLIKRMNNVKDSGSILPGHGGVLDRIDSLTAALPVFISALWIWEALR